MPQRNILTPFFESSMSYVSLLKLGEIKRNNQIRVWKFLLLRKLSKESLRGWENFSQLIQTFCHRSGGDVTTIWAYWRKKRTCSICPIQVRSTHQPPKKSLKQKALSIPMFKAVKTLLLLLQNRLENAPINHLPLNHIHPWLINCSCIEKLLL